MSTQAPAASAQATSSETNRWVVLVLVCLAQFMVVLDATIVNVALPSIQSDLNFSPGNLAWIINSYTLLFGGFLLLGGRAADLFGRKRVFLAGVVLFSIASGLCALSTSQGVLIAPMLPHLARLVTHLDVTDDDLDRAITVLGGLLAQ